MLVSRETEVVILSIFKSPIDLNLPTLNVMNSEKVVKSPNSDDSNSSSAGASNSNYSENGNKTKTNETTNDPIGDEKNITLNDFLDFLNVSCHVNDMITNSVQAKASTCGRTSSKSTTNVDFENLAKNRLVNDLYGHNEYNNLTGRSIKPTNDQEDRERLRYRRRTLSVGATSTGRHGSKRQETPRKGLHPKLNEKLDYMLNEGVMDTILPFICPVPVPMAFSRQNAAKNKPKEVVTESNNETNELGEKAVKARGDATKTVGSVRRKSLLSSRGVRTRSGEKKGENDVIIHVCDEVKNTSRDFFCPQSLLVKKMGYFADVTAGQKLEDMDISVHCDIQIFDWLMRWVKYSARIENTGSQSSAMPLEAEPQLDASNVVPILVSASFLQMEPLLVDCLSFCHSRLSEVVRASTNLSCMNDSILTRLAAMFTNVELECVRDKKERVTPRLWTKLIQSLCEPEPEALRGHYYSLAGLFRCARCGKCLTKTMEPYVTCPSNLRVNRWGQLVSRHVRDPNWNMSAFISQLFKELKSWRLVYWKLWGHCHYLYCFLCEMHFPVFQLTWCRYHPEVAQFLGPSTEGRNTGPVGRYPCCGQQAFRFDPLPGPIGCQFREHSIQAETDRDRAIQTIIQLVSENYALCESPPHKLKERIACSEVGTRWSGISLTPRGARQGLLPELTTDEHSCKSMRRPRSDRTYFSESSSDTDSSDDELQSATMKKNLGGGASCRDFSSSSDGCESESNRVTKKVYSKKGSKRHPDRSGRYWSGEISARSNQDHQREFEEKVMKKVIAIVNKKTASEHSLPVQSMPMGGSYVRLEAEWKDHLKTRNSTSNIISTGSNQQLSNVKQRNK